MEDEFSCYKCGALQDEECPCGENDFNTITKKRMDILAARAWNIDVPIQRESIEASNSRAMEFSREVRGYVESLGFKVKK